MQVLGIDFDYSKRLIKLTLKTLKTFINKCKYIFICYCVTDYINEKIYNTKRYFRNLIKYQYIIKKDEWWDFFHFEELIIFKLKDLEKHWEKDTHYVGDCFTKKRIQYMLKEWNKIKEYEDEHPFDKKVDKMREEWFRKLGKLMPRLWD